ncbi:hypothetical protein JTB14_024004 [Gonioctena quinquepunctata]|nr:hypothetical protein JTB14_024004 [Gonioctena quinquepunctata]
MNKWLFRDTTSLGMIEKSRGGGVCLYIKSNYKYSIIQTSQSIEQLWIRLIIGNKSFAVGVTYNPPNSDQALFLDHFENTVSQISPSNDTLICLGDFNTDLMEYDTRPAIDISNVFEGVGLYQLIENPTRITDHTTSLIDFILISDLSLVNNCGPMTVPDVSDHELIYCKLNIKCKGNKVSAGQQVHLTGDLKGNVSIAAQQGMHFSQHSSPNGSTPTQPNSNTNQQHQQQHQHSQHSPMSSSQHQNSPMNNMGSQSSMNHQSSSQIGSDMLSGNQQMPSSQQHSVGPSMQGMGGLSSSGNMPGPDNISGNMSGLGNLGMPSNNMGHNSGMGGLNSNLGGSGSLPSSMGGMHPGMHHVGGMGSGHSDTYSLSQTQTINFTQQSLQRTNGPGVPNRMGPTGPLGPGSMTNQTNMGPRLLNAQQSLEQQKLLHQQQMMRAQQAAMQQHIVRPPPPDYKASAGMMQGMQPRYATTPQNIRRMPHQPIPPSGPMMRSNMFMLPQQQQQQQQQQIPQRTVMYSRQQQGPLPGIEQHNPSEWRHLLMTQQQNSSFNSMRPNFQQGFNMNSGSIQQLTALQHQQIRTQQGMVSSGLTSNQQNMNQGMGQGQVVTQGGNPMTQINNMNQAMLHMQQQQQQSLMQQHNPHMSMSNIHMQQSQSITVTNHQQGNMNNQLSNTSSTNQSNALSNFNPQADFSLEFLENLAASDTGTFTDQDLLNSFDSDAGFNLDF